MFSFQSVGHFFASVAHDIKTAADEAAKFVAKNQSTIISIGETAATIVSVADPALAPVAQSIERAGEALLGEVFAALTKVDAAANAPLNISLDTAAVTELKTLFGQVQSLKGAAAVPPAALTAAAATPATQAKA